MTQTTMTTPLADVLNDLTDQNPKMRKNAASLLRLDYPSQALKPLCNLLLDERADVRSHVAKELGKLKDKNAVGPLLLLLGDQSMRVRIQAIKAVAKLKDPSAIQPLLNALQDPSLGVRLAAIEALGTLGDPRATPVLINMLQTTDKPLLLTVLIALGALRDPQAIPALLPLFQHTNQSVQRIAIRTLGEIGTEAAIDPLVELASAWDTQEYAATWAIMALATIGGNRALSELLTLYRNNEHINLRFWIIRVLKQVKRVDGQPKDEAIELLLQALHSADQRVPFNAAEALRDSFKTERAIQPLIALLSSTQPPPYMIESATLALLKINSPRVLAEILQLYRATNSEDEVHIRLLNFLWQYKKRKHAEHEDVFQLLLQALNTSNERMLMLAVQALGNAFKDVRAVEPLLALLSSKNRLIVRVTAVALGNIGDTRAIEPLLHVLEQDVKDHFVIKALGHFKDQRVFVRLLQLLDPLLTVSELQQYLLITILGSFGDPRVIEPFEAFIANPASPYRGHVQLALERLKPVTGLQA